jgi:phosphoenolpyruvate synthase/pyruvate phosphate dikinase
MATLTLPEAEVHETKNSSTKYVYFFGGGKADGNGKMKDDLGGKGAGLAEMTNAGLPVPPGFTIQTEACREYMRHNAKSRRKSTGRWMRRWPNWNPCRVSSWASARIRCW